MSLNKDLVAVFRKNIKVDLENLSKGIPTLQESLVIFFNQLGKMNPDLLAVGVYYGRGRLTEGTATSIQKKSLVSNTGIVIKSWYEKEDIFFPTPSETTLVLFKKNNPAEIIDINSVEDLLINKNKIKVEVHHNFLPVMTPRHIFRLAPDSWLCWLRPNFLSHYTKDKSLLQLILENDPTPIPETTTILTKTVWRTPDVYLKDREPLPLYRW